MPRCAQTQVSSRRLAHNHVPHTHCCHAGARSMLYTQAALRTSFSVKPIHQPSTKTHERTAATKVHQARAQQQQLRQSHALAQQAQQSFFDGKNRHAQLPAPACIAARLCQHLKLSASQAQAAGCMHLCTASHLRSAPVRLQHTYPPPLPRKTSAARSSNASHTTLASSIAVSGLQQPRSLTTDLSACQAQAAG